MNIRPACRRRVARPSRRPSNTFVVSLIAILVCCPKDARADGTLLFWASGFYLLLGTAIIGLSEGLFISFVFRLKRRTAMGWCVLAVYVSAFVAGLIRWKLELLASVLLGEHPFENAAWTSALLALALWLLSVFIEWPFIHQAFGSNKDSWRKSLKASLGAQTVSYAILLPLVLLVSDRSLMAWHSDPTLPSQAPTDSFVYYADHEGRVWQSSYDGHRSLVAGPFPAGGGTSSLEVGQGSDGASNDIVLVNRNSQGAEAWREVVVSHISTDGPLMVSQDWNLRINYDGSGSMTLYQRHTHEVQDLGWDTPVMTIWLRDAVEVGNDRIVFVANRREVILADVGHRTFAPIAMGTTVLVVRKGIPVQSNHSGAGNDLEW